MSLRFVDSFAHYSTAQAARKYFAAAMAIVTPGRFGAGSACASLTSTTVFLGSQATLGAAFGISNPGLQNANGVLLSFFDGGTAQLTLWVTAGYVSARRGSASGTVLGNSTAVIPSTGWHHIEARVTIGAAGSVDVWLDSVNILHLAGVNTQNSANPTADRIIFNSDAQNATLGYYQADLVVYDGQAGAGSAGSVGDCRVQALLPTGAGNYTEFSTLVGAATQWQAEAENPADDDTSYIASATAGQRSTFATADLTPTSGVVIGIAINSMSRKDDGGARTIAGMCRSAGADKAAAGQALGATYAILQDVMETDPASAAWTIASVNAAEFGVKEIA